MAQPTPEQPVYPGQKAKTLYAQKIRRRGGARRQQHSQPGANRQPALLWISLLLAMLLLLWLR